MARLPSRKELAAKVDQLERDLQIFAAGGGAGAVLARSPAARAAAVSGVARITPAALAADLLIRQEDALLARGVEVASPIVGQAISPVTEPLTEAFTAFSTPAKVEASAKAKPRKKSKFNKAVSSGLKALKSSTKYGKRGTINNAKAAFKTATKAASAVLKGKKAPKSGPSKVAYTAAKKVYKDEILRRKMK
tara:strand:+ start:407 stop:982 length:576 start_codon:yes stop_codon:yes gene_type:complete